MKERPVKTKKSRMPANKKAFGSVFRKKNAAERQLPIVRKKRRLKYIAVIPSFITLMNGACGFISMVFASHNPSNFPLFRGSGVSSFAMAGYMIFFAMIADVLDGRIARLTRTTSSFGGQLDSLSDAISFGAAPAFLMIKVVESHLVNLQLEPSRFLQLAARLFLFCGIFYAMCALVRLARFNVENEEDESAHMNFYGIPSPGAAGVIASLIVFQQRFMPVIAVNSPEIYRTLEMVTVIALPVITLFSGILMVTRLRYPHVANHLLRSKKTLPALLTFFAAGIFIVWNIQLAAVLCFCGFAVFGVIRWLVLCIVKKVRGRPSGENLSI